MKLNRTVSMLSILSLMALSLAACGSDNGNGASPSASGESAPASPSASSSSSQAASEPASPSEEAPAIEPEDGASLVIWEDKNQRSFIEAAAKDFEAKYGVPVKFEELSPTDQVTKLTTDGPAGLGADVVVFPHDQIGRAAQAGLVLPNDVFADEATSENADNAVNAVTYDGVLYGYPYNVETYALFYNKKLIPNAPKTFDEIVEFAKTFNDVKNNKYAIMWELQQFYYDYAFLASNGGYMFGDNNTNKNDIGLNNDGAVEGGKFMQQLKESVLPIKTGDVNYDIKKGLFSGGTLAMDINGPWAISDYRSAGVDFGIAPLPSINGKPMTSFSGVKAYYVNAYTKYPNASKLLAEFLSSKESQLKNFEMNGILPSNKEAAGDPKVANDEFTKAFLEQFNNSTPMPSIPEMASVWGPITSAIADIWDGGKDVKTSLDKAVSQIKEAISSGQ